MRTMMYIVSTAAVLTASAATHVPVRWTVETSRVQPISVDAYQGEKLELEATMQSYGKPFAIAGDDVRIYWQTNGMGSAWWSAPAELKTGSGPGPDGYRATWLPEYDAGAGVYNCFIGEPAGNYRAEFRLRLRPSPGATPNTLRLPDVTYDARLNGTPTVNGTNLVDFVKIEAGAETDPTVPDWAKQPNPPVSAPAGTVTTNSSGVLDGPLGGVYMSMYPDIAPRNIEISPSDLDVLRIRAESETFIFNGLLSGKTDDDVVRRKDLPAAPEDIGAAPAGIADIVNAWQTYWDGDDVRVTVTNYYGTLGMSGLYIEQKMPAGDGHAEPWFRVVWDERTRWNTFMPAFTAVTNEVQQNKADRAWGVYDSSTGAYSPDGLLQVSQEQIMIASGMAWQKTITAGGCAVWILKATDPTTFSGETENGYFRIQDGDGNPLFEVVKGDKRVVGAVATDVQVSGGAMTVRYNSVSDEHPTMEVCTDLLTPDWQTEDACTVARVTWGGSSGAWVATVTPIGAPRAMFARATFEAGGNTYIRNHVAASMDRVVVGGQEYTVTVQTVNGKKLLVLE